MSTAGSLVVFPVSTMKSKEESVHPLRRHISHYWLYNFIKICTENSAIKITQFHEHRKLGIEDQTV